ncbi:hypothetical protein D3C78_1128400 [compost metagenome]
MSGGGAGHGVRQCGRELHWATRRRFGSMPVASFGRGCGGRDGCPGVASRPLLGCVPLSADARDRHACPSGAHGARVARAHAREYSSGVAGAAEVVARAECGAVAAGHSRGQEPVGSSGWRALAGAVPAGGAGGVRGNTRTLVCAGDGNRSRAGVDARARRACIRVAAGCRRDARSPAGVAGAGPRRTQACAARRRLCRAVVAGDAVLSFGAGAV